MIRRLKNKDKGILVTFEKNMHELEPDVFTSAFDENVYRENLSSVDLEKDNMILAYFEDDIMIARCDVVIYKSLMDFEKSAYIDWLYVLRPYRKRGVATKLIDEAIEISRKLTSEIYLFTADNKEAQTFYKGHKKLELKSRQVASYRGD